jgi:ketosteroid isomerase-like protein
MTNAELIKTYFDAWVNGDKATVAGMLADDMKLTSPQESYDSAEAFLDACWKYSEVFESIECIHIVSEGTTSMLCYEGTFKDGKYRMCEFYEIVDGKIKLADVLSITPLDGGK